MSKPSKASSLLIQHNLTHPLLQETDEKAEEAYKKMEDAFRVQLGLIAEGVTAL